MATTLAPSKEAVTARLRAGEARLRALGIQHLALFGSVARGDAGAESDVDVVVELDDAARWSLVELSGARLTLEDMLDAPVGLVVRDDLKPGFRARIEADLVEVF